MKPIETTWMGFKFRSRTEARWAVFFSAMGWRWEYEPEGFQFADGTRYLPDFLLYAGKKTVWVEVKPFGEPKQVEQAKARKLQNESKRTVWMLCGQPSMKKDSYRIVVVLDEDNSIDDDGEAYTGIAFDNPHVIAPCRKCNACQLHWSECGENYYVTEHTGLVFEPCELDECTDKFGSGDWSRINRALTAASSERFGT